LIIKLSRYKIGMKANKTTNPRGRGGQQIANNEPVNKAAKKAESDKEKLGFIQLRLKKST